MTRRRFDWVPLASKVAIALLLISSGSLAIALLADYFIFLTEDHHGNGN